MKTININVIGDIATPDNRDAGAALSSLSLLNISDVVKNHSGYVSISVIIT